MTPAGASSCAERLQRQAARIAAAGQSSPREGRDPVNLPMIRNWQEAIGDDSPAYTDPAFAASTPHAALVAPPAMAQVWTMPGLRPARSADDPLGLMSSLLDDAGFTSVVATNCDQQYHRYLRHGEHVSVRTALLGLTGPKRTALGDGWFVTTRSTWSVAGEAVATMDFRILKFRPAANGLAGPVPRPPVSGDTEFFWAGTAAGELRIQRCGSCGALRHPPGPMCPHCGSTSGGYVVAAGAGEVFSYVVHHHPPLPGRKLPAIVALVQLPEGVRMVGELLGIDRDRVEIGLPVQVSFQQVADALTIPAWRPLGPSGHSPGTDPDRQPWAASSGAAGGGASRSGGEPAGAPGDDTDTGSDMRSAGTALPELVIDVTPTFVISAAIATRDFTDVHHDRERARARGGKDIFLNILTTTGLVQRFVSGWAGPGAVFRSISVRLGVPCYAGDTLTFTGQVTSRNGGRCHVAVTGQCGPGTHVTGTAVLDIPGERP